MAAVLSLCATLLNGGVLESEIMKYRNNKQKEFKHLAEPKSINND